MIKAIALDNEPAVLDLVKKYCAATGFIHFLKAFTKPEEALRYLNNFPAQTI